MVSVPGVFLGGLVVVYRVGMLSGKLAWCVPLWLYVRWAYCVVIVPSGLPCHNKVIDVPDGLPQCCLQGEND